MLEMREHRPPSEAATPHVVDGMTSNPFNATRAKRQAGCEGSLIFDELIQRVLKFSQKFNFCITSSTFRKYGESNL